MNNELMHAVGNDPAWSESYYFNFVDPDQHIGMFTRMGFRPGSGWADALHVLYLAEKRIAFTYGRRQIEPDLAIYDGDLHAGDLTLECAQPHRQWRLRYSGPAQDIADGQILLQRSKARPQGWFTPAHLDMALTFDCLTEPHYAAAGEHGHFEQAGHVHGSLTLDGRQWQVDGYGVRDKSWGPRDWGAGNRGSQSMSSAADGVSPFVNWFSMNFSDYAALGGSCFRHPDGIMRGEGWLQRDGTSTSLHDVTIETRYAPGSIIHESLELAATTAAGEVLRISGQVLNVCPTKIAMPGGATFINEGLTRFVWGDRTGYGIAEHWHAVDLTS